MSDQNREDKPESIPAPEPVVDSAFDAIPGASAASTDPATPIVPPAPPTADPAAAAAAPVPPAAPADPGTPVPPPAPPAPPQDYPGAAANGYPSPAPGNYPGAAPGQTPAAYPGAPGATPYAGGAYPGQPYGAAPVPSTTRPRQVVSACVLAWVIAGLGVLGLLGALALMSQYGVDGAFLAGALFIPVLTIIGLAVFAIFTWQGKGWARIALTVMFAINTIGGLANIGNGAPQSILGVLLSIGAIVLLWLPASSAWFAVKRQSA